MAIDPSLVLLVGGILLLVGGSTMLLAYRRGQRPPPPPVVSSPHHRRRAERDAAMMTGVRLAIAIAGCDGEVHASEMDAITAFLTEQVKRRDVPWAARMMRGALQTPGTPMDVSASLAELASMDGERRDLVLQLLVHVARADGVFREQERAFLVEAARCAGLTSEAIAALVAEAATVRKGEDRQEDS